MSRAWMPLYIGDYIKNTRDLTTVQHGAYLLLIMHYWEHACLPQTEQQLASIAGLTLKDWRKLSPPIRAKFGPEWKHGRIDAELIKCDTKRAQRAIAGRDGGIKSGLARAIKRGEQILDDEAKSKRLLRRSFSKPEPNGEAESKPPGTSHQVSKIDSSLENPRDEIVEDSEEPTSSEVPLDALKRAIRGRKKPIPFEPTDELVALVWKQQGVSR